MYVPCDSIFGRGSSLCVCGASSTSSAVSSTCVGQHFRNVGSSGSRRSIHSVSPWVCTSEPYLLEVTRVDVHAGDALAVEHRDVATVVLEREPRIEVVGAELLDAAPLELRGRLVVAVVAHDQQVPTQLVALEPRDGDLLHADRPAGQQHDREPIVEQFEQPPDFGDERVIPTRVEEGVPVAAAAFEVVLTTGGVGQHAIDVEHDRGATGERLAPPAPVVGSRRPHSSVGDSAARFLISSTTAGSASVVVSPRARPSATSRSKRRMIFPERVFGSSSVKITVLGRAVGPIFLATCWRNSSPSAALVSVPPL